MTLNARFYLKCALPSLTYVCWAFGAGYAMTE